MADYELTFIIPEAQAIRARDALAGSFGWKDDTGETKAEFVHRSILITLKNRVLRYERQQAIEGITDTPIDIT